MKKIARIKKEDFIRIAPEQFSDLMEFCGYFKKSKRETNPIHHDSNMLVLADLYDWMRKKSGVWEYYPIASYRAFKLKYSEYFILAIELMNHCPTHALNDVLERLDHMFLNYYNFSLKDRQKAQTDFDSKH